MGQVQAARPRGYNYSHFCDHFRQWRDQRQGTLHQEHEPGRELYMYFAVKPLVVTDRSTVAMEPVEEYVATLGSSHHTYVEAIPSQRKEDFLYAVVNALEYFGGVSRLWIPDNMKSAVTRADNYEAQVNRDLVDRSNHNGSTVLPTQSRKPRDKAIAEKAFSMVYPCIHAYS